jgi:NAD(P)-dependent dehydrogenase (short-subunit alcohol dehydrogenase family)
MTVSGKSAVVTGGASGIGRAIATELAERGADVAIGDLKREPSLEEETTPTVELVRERGVEGVFVETDVGTDDGAAELVSAAADAFGGIDVLVNNAGMFRPGDVEAVTPEVRREIFDTNVGSVYNTARHAMKHLRESDRARMVNMSSTLGLVGRDECAAYGPTKAAIANLTQQMAIDYADDEILVNAINPGIIRTDMTAEKLSDERRPMLEEVTPLPYFGQPEDVAHLAAFLASDHNRFITGTCIPIDGGYTAH